MSPKYVITHFPIIGRNEPDRIMFHAAGVEFVNQTIQKGEEWQKAKPDVTRSPLGQMPILEVDGKVIVQSFAIHRYIATELGFYAENNWDRALIDQIGETLNELIDSIIPFVYGKKSQEDKKAGLINVFTKEKTKRILDFISNILKENNGGTGFVVGNKLSLGDIIFLVADDLIQTNHCEYLVEYPELKALVYRKRNIENIKKYLDGRK